MPLHENDHAARHSRFNSLATFVLVVAMLRLAREIVIPVALAALLALLLSPGVNFLMRLGLKKTLAVIAAALVAFAIIAGLAWLVAVQAMNVVQELPRYENNIANKMQRLEAPHPGSPIARLTNLFERVQKQIDSERPPAANPPPGVQPGEKPLPVEVEPRQSSVFQLTRSLAGMVVGPLGDAFIVAVFLIAILLQREDLRLRFLRLTRAEGLEESMRAVDDATHRVSRYLLMQLVVNASYGVPVGLGLYLIGIPNASLWALFSTLLRFIPYVGVWIAAAFPVAFSIAITPGWSKLFLTLGLFVVFEAVTANVVEPWVYGARTGVSSLALMLAALFWTWLWGPAGLFLSTPLTVCLTVMGKYSPGFQIFSTLLGHEAPPERSRARPAFMVRRRR